MKTGCLHPLRVSRAVATLGAALNSWPHLRSPSLQAWTLRDPPQEGVIPGLGHVPWEPAPTPGSTASCPSEPCYHRRLWVIWVSGSRPLDGPEFEQAPGDGEGQGSLVCCRPWGRRVRHDLVSERQSSRFYWISNLLRQNIKYFQVITGGNEPPVDTQREKPRSAWWPPGRTAFLQHATTQQLFCFCSCVWLVHPNQYTPLVPMPTDNSPCPHSCSLLSRRGLK